jgi:hypothetical protein
MRRSSPNSRSPAPDDLTSRSSARPGRVVGGQGGEVGGKGGADTGWRPSAGGFGFGNAFGDRPAFVRRWKWGKVHAGTAARGLCGGMVLAAADYWAAGKQPPPRTFPPAEDDPLWAHLVRRQVASFRLPFGALRYLAWMQPAAPARVRMRWLTRRALPKVLAVLDTGRVCPVGLVMVRSVWPWRVVDHHQVLAWGYKALSENRVELRAYDPNRPGADDVVLEVSERGARLAAGDGKEEPVFALFATGWRPRVPPS